jgi:hypothetical protein
VSTTGLNKLVKAVKSPLLVTPQHEQWLAKNPNVELSDETAQWVAKELQARQRDRSGTWSASSLGGCKRKHIYTFLGTPHERGVAAGTAAIFQHGTWSHLKWQASGYMAGWLGQTEVSCSLPAYKGTGTIDGILASNAAGWELKTINARGYRFVLNDGPKHEHLLQIHFYMLATKLHVWSLIYEEKDTQDYKEFVVTYKDAYAANVLDELDELNHHVETQTLPIQQPGCITKTTSEYRTCPFRNVCEEHRWPTRKRLMIIKTSTSDTPSTGTPTP